MGVVVNGYFLAHNSYTIPIEEKVYQFNYTTRGLWFGRESCEFCIT
nr:MAG TPA: hypothetical protein [Caudoviricetes sp.]